MYIKNFDTWNLKKQNIDAQPVTIAIRAGEVRWVSFGINIGNEINGKGRSFTRPTLIVHVYANYSALVVPLTSREKFLPGFVSFDFEEKTVAACVHQLRVVSQKRIFERLGRISAQKFLMIKKAVVDFFHLCDDVSLTQLQKNMPHLHPLIDFTVTCMILHPTQPRALLIHHKALNTWLPVGGHIELDEDPDQALLREVQEECGLPITVLSERHSGEYPETKMLWRPETVDIHKISSGEQGGHRHINLGYHARALSAEPHLAAEEHHDIKWFSAEEISDPALNIKPAIRDYTLEFLKKYG